MNILGIHDGHNASATLVVDGKVVLSAQEERYRYQKNFMGFPDHAIASVLNVGNISVDDLDIVAMSGIHEPRGLEVSRIREIFRFEQEHYIRSRVLWIGRSTPFYRLYTARLRAERVRELRRAGFPVKKLRFIEHHLCHAAAAYYGSPWRDHVLVLTLDGGGDKLAATVSVASGSSIDRVAATSDTDSIGNIYSRVTFTMGFVPWEHEYKIMGLAPYASVKNSAHLKDLFSSYLRLSDSNPLVFRRGIPEATRLICRRLRQDLAYARFDEIAGGLQAFTEDLIVRWVRSAIERTGIRKLALGGGVFMNVKVNKLIAEMPEVEDVFVFPSCGDESNSIGAALQAYVQESGQMPQPIGPIYWGPTFSGEEVEHAIEDCCKNGFEFDEVNDIEGAIADLLLEHKIVARVAGPMEFGARALGNRSILADPSDLRNVQTINRMIKMRDFWMPFAPVILAERQDEYMRRTKPVKSPYMMFAFDSEPSRRHEMIAAIHQADWTMRPQIIERDYNPAYYEIIRRFEKKTGRGVLLNTSYNLHGYPITLGPREALSVFNDSGLEYLALGNYLLSKVQ
jgi:carbamoyltransferase